MAFVTKDDHVDEGLGNLIEQFKDKANLRAYLTVFLNQIQDLEDAFNQILTLTDQIDIAFGQQLDNIGQIIGEERFGRNDIQYRVALKARIILNTSGGTIENIVALIVALQPGLAVEVIEFFPASFLAKITPPIDPDLIDINQIANIVKSGRPAGVKGQVQFNAIAGKKFDTAGAGFDLGKFGVVLETC